MVTVSILFAGKRYSCNSILRSFAGIVITILASCTDPVQTDILIAGGGTSGVAAGIQATRLQPVVLQIGQAAGALAALAVREGAFLIDKALDPFNAMDVNITGDFIR